MTLVTGFPRDFGNNRLFRKSGAKPVMDAPSSKKPLTISSSRCVLHGRQTMP